MSDWAHVWIEQVIVHFFYLLFMYLFNLQRASGCVYDIFVAGAKPER